VPVNGLGRGKLARATVELQAATAVQAVPVTAWPPIAVAGPAAWGAAVARARRTGNPVAGAVAAIASGTGRFLAEAAEAAVVAAVPLGARAVADLQRAPAVRAVLPAPVVLVAAVVVVAAAAVAAGAGKRRRQAMIEEKQHMKSSSRNVTLGKIGLLGALVLCGLRLQAAPQSAQKTFATPELAFQALIQAADPYNVPALLEILGPDGKDIVSSEDQVEDKNRATAFVALAREKHVLTPDPKNPARVELTVGNDDWPMPVPIVKRNGQWSFDMKAGRQEMLFRRIGENELDAITVCRGFVEAQLEYALDKHDGSELNQYAQRIISTTGKHDGLAWQNPDGSWGGPVGEAAAKALQDGYSTGEPFHGYFFKVLKGQGPAAPLGELDFVVRDVMIGGFALAASPAQYGVTGIQTFIVSHDGIVYQKDLGAATQTAFKAMERYNPDKTWTRTDDEP
jgi:hypothetical protein